MASGDGLMVRVRAGANALSTAQLRALTALAHRYGPSDHAQLELTRRGNLQLRGLAAEAVASVQREVVQLGLAAADPDVEHRLALLVDPLSGLAAQLAELAPLAAAIEQVLCQGHAHAQAGALPSPGLPSKFGIVLAGGDGRLGAVFADIRIVVTRERPEFARLSLAGDAQTAAELGECALALVPAVVWRLLQLRAASTAPRRVALVAEARALLGATVVPRAVPEVVSPELAAIGFHSGLVDWFGFGVPFGAADAATWSALADIADSFGRAEVRMTSERSVIVPGVRASDRAQLSAAGQRLGLITEPNDPLLRVEACPGAPACASALGETRSWARQLARVLHEPLSAGASLHVSGCDKGCASSARASVTLVHAADGCRLGWAADTTGAAASSGAPLAAVEQQLAYWAAGYAQPRRVV
ncbi:MAG: hypothetical protein RL701_1354 [Pseudomonadota bacterium]|jgi:precorrin-3B synthase